MTAVLALVLATLFASAALYISLVEHPARATLSDAAQLAQWQPSYARALPLQGGLALAGGAAGIIAWATDGDALRLIGSLLLLANWPVTIGAILPVNRRLNATSPEKADATTRALLVRWGRLHHVRSALGAGSSLCFAVAVAGAPAGAG